MLVEDFQYQLNTRCPKPLDLTADHADYADTNSIRAISGIRGL